MPTIAIEPGYHGDYKDSQEDFHGNLLVYIGWDKHCFFCASRAYPLAPDMTFGSVISDVMPEAFSQHPEYSKIQWENVQWILNGEPFVPDYEASLESQGFDHKCLLRFVTPELKGYANAGI